MFGLAHGFAHNAVGADGALAFKAARPEGAAGFGTLLIDRADGLTGLEFEMGAMPAGKIHKAALALLKQAFRRQLAVPIFGQQDQITRMLAETAGSAGDAVKRRIGHRVM